MYKILILIILLVSGCASTMATRSDMASGSHAPESILFAIPKGWRVAHSSSTAAGDILELIASNETLDNWTRMVTIQTFYRRYEPEPFILSMAEESEKRCDQTEVLDVINYVQNGHPFAQKIIVCTGIRGGTENETMNIKAIQGDEKFYVVQFSNNTPLSLQEGKYWSGYLRDVVVANY